MLWILAVVMGGLSLGYVTVRRRRKAGLALEPAAAWAARAAKAEGKAKKPKGEKAEGEGEKPAAEATQDKPQKQEKQESQE